MWYFPYIFAGCNWFSYDLKTMNNVKTLLCFFNTMTKIIKKKREREEIKAPINAQIFLQAVWLYYRLIRNISNLCNEMVPKKARTH